MSIRTKRNTSYRAGQGLMELIVAIGIIILALSSIISLTIFNVSSQRISENEIIASNLAREGIEVVRHLRDSSRLAGLAFVNSSFVPNQTDHTAIAAFNASSNAWTLNFTVNSMQTAPLYRHNTDNVYTHSAVGGTQSIFKRLLTIDYICENKAQCGGDGICDGASRCTHVIGQRVRSRVEWNDRGSTKHFELVNHLYEWK